MKFHVASTALAAALALLLAIPSGASAKSSMKGDVNGAFKANKAKKIIYTSANTQLSITGTQLSRRSGSKSVSIMCLGVTALQPGPVSSCIATVFFINPFAGSSQTWVTREGTLTVNIDAVKGKSATISFSGTAEGDSGNGFTPLTMTNVRARMKVSAS